MSSFVVSKLECPDCGFGLNGLGADSVFTCKACNVAFDIQKGAWTRYPMLFAPVARGTDLSLLYLPLWKLTVEVRIVDETGKDSTADSIVADLDTVWVCGFYENRPSYFGNPGLELTENRTCLLNDLEPPIDAAVVGVQRSQPQAARYAQVFIAAMLDRVKDVTGTDIQVKIVGTELWALPFADDIENKKIINLATENTYSDVIVENLQEIREYKSRS